MKTETEVRAEIKALKSDSRDLFRLDDLEKVFS